MRCSFREGSRTGAERSSETILTVCVSRLRLPLHFPVDAAAGAGNLFLLLKKEPLVINASRVKC